MLSDVEVHEAPALRIVRRVYEELSPVIRMVYEVKTRKDADRLYIALAYLQAIREGLPGLEHVGSSALEEVSRTLAAQYEKIWPRRGSRFAVEYLTSAKQLLGRSPRFVDKLLYKAGVPFPSLDELVNNWFVIDGEQLLREINKRVAALRRASGKVASLFIDELLRLCGYVPESIVEDVARRSGFSKEWLYYHVMRRGKDARLVRAYAAEIRDLRAQMAFLMYTASRAALKRFREGVKCATLGFVEICKRAESRVESLCEAFVEAAVEALLNAASGDYSDAMARFLRLEEYNALMRVIGILAYRQEGYSLFDIYGKLNHVSERELRALTGSFCRLLTAVTLMSLAESKGMPEVSKGVYKIGTAGECFDYLMARIAPIYRDLWEKGSKEVSKIIKNSMKELTSHEVGVLVHIPESDEYVFVERDGSSLLPMISFMKGVAESKLVKAAREGLKMESESPRLHQLPEFLQGLSRERRRAFLEAFAYYVDDARVFLRYHLRMTVGEALYAMRLVPLPAGWLRRLAPRRDVRPLEAFLRRTSLQRLYMRRSSVLYLLHYALLEALFDERPEKIKEKVSEVVERQGGQRPK